MRCTRRSSIKWLPVNPATRIDAVADGQVDLECGSTTSNLERQKRVSFSPTMFVSGTKLLVKNGSPIKSFRDLAGQTVAVTGGTTNEKTMRDLSARFKLEPEPRGVAGPRRVVRAGQGRQGRRVRHRRRAAVRPDRAGQGREQGRSDYQVVGEFLSYDPYGMMFRKGDAQLASGDPRHLRHAGAGRRDRAPVQALVPAQAACRHEHRSADEPAARDHHSDRWVARPSSATLRADRVSATRSTDRSYTTPHNVSQSAPAMSVVRPSASKKRLGIWKNARNTPPLGDHAPCRLPAGRQMNWPALHSMPRVGAAAIDQMAFEHEGLLDAHVLVVGQHGAGRHARQRGHQAAGAIEQQRLDLDARVTRLLPWQASRRRPGATPAAPARHGLAHRA